MIIDWTGLQAFIIQQGQYNTTCFSGVLLGENIVNTLSRSSFVDKMAAAAFLHFYPQIRNV